MGNQGQKIDAIRWSRRETTSAKSIPCSLLVLIVCCQTSYGADLFPFVPSVLDLCLKQVESKATVMELYIGINPFYLRGDFDGDGKVDYVAQVVRPLPPNSKEPAEIDIDRSGLLFCLGSGKVDVMGANLGPMPPGTDPLLFISPEWEALAPASSEVESLDAAGDVVMMMWETGVGAIYLKAGTYRWHWIE